MGLLAKSHVTWDGHALPCTKGSKKERPVLSASRSLRQGGEKKPKQPSQPLPPIAIIVCKRRAKETRHVVPPCLLHASVHVLSGTLSDRKKGLVITSFPVDNREGVSSTDEGIAYKNTHKTAAEEHASNGCDS